MAGASPPRCWPHAARGDRRRARPVRGRRGLARRRSPRSSTRARSLLGNLFRDQLDRYGELETIADRWARCVDAPARTRPRAQRRRPADRRPRPRPTRRGRRLLRRRGRLAWRCPSCSTPPTPSTAAAAARPTSTTRVYLGHLGHYHCPNCGATRPGPQVAAQRRSSCDGIARRRVHRCARRPASARVELPLPGLYNVYNALARRRAGARAGRRRWTTIAAGLADRRAPPSGAPRRVDGSAGTRALDPAGQEPRRRQRGAAHARARGRASTTCWRAQRQHRRRPRRLLDLGRRLRAARGPRPPRHLRRHARGRDGPAAEVRGRDPRTGIVVEPTLERALDRGACARGARAAVRAPHLHRAAGAARAARRAAARATGVASR